jgi:hypothetical protein
MVEKEYRVKGGSRFVGVIVGLAFALVGVLMVAVLGQWIGLLIVAIGAVAIWAGLRPNKLLFLPDALEVRSLGVKQYPYAQIRRVRMVARRFFHSSKSYVGTRQGNTSTKIAVGGKRYRMYPEIVIEGDFPQPLVLEVESTTQLYDEEGNALEGAIFRTKRGSRFHVPDVLTDLLPCLSSEAAVDDSVRQYAATGMLPEVGTLPVENPKLSDVMRTAKSQ